MQQKGLQGGTRSVTEPNWAKGKKVGEKSEE